MFNTTNGKMQMERGTNCLASTISHPSKFVCCFCPLPRFYSMSCKLHSMFTHNYKKNVFVFCFESNLSNYKTNLICSKIDLCLVVEGA